MCVRRPCLLPSLLFISDVLEYLLSPSVSYQPSPALRYSAPPSVKLEPAYLDDDDAGSGAACRMPSPFSLADHDIEVALASIREDASEATGAVTECATSACTAATACHVSTAACGSSSHSTAIAPCAARPRDVDMSVLLPSRVPDTPTPCSLPLATAMFAVTPSSCGTGRVDVRAFDRAVGVVSTCSVDTALSSRRHHHNSNDSDDDDDDVCSVEGVGSREGSLVGGVDDSFVFGGADMSPLCLPLTAADVEIDDLYFDSAFPEATTTAADPLPVLRCRCGCWPVVPAGQGTDIGALPSSSRQLTASDVMAAIGTSFSGVVPKDAAQWCLVGQLSDGTTVPLGSEQRVFGAVSGVLVHRY